MSAIIDYRGKTPRKTVSGIPLITARIVKGGRIETPTEFIDPLEYDLWMRRGLPQVGDVVVTTEAPLGEVAQLTNDRVALAQRLILLRGKPEVLNNTYLKYLMMSVDFQSQLHGRASGTTVVGIKQSELRKIVLSLPPITEQRAIAGILGALDDKIEQNRRASLALERLARAVFQAWFVDFEPVKTKAAGAQSFPSMAQDTFNLVPNTLIDSPLGLSPDGWPISRLDQILKVNPVYRLPKGTIAAYLDMAQMPTEGHSPDAWVMREVGSGAKFTNGDTLVARITPCLENGKTAYVDFLAPGEIAWGSTEYIVLRPNEPIPEVYAYLLARSSEFRAFAIQSMTGTSGRQRVPFNAISSYQIALPPREIFLAFANVANPLFRRSAAAVRESRRLAMIRDVLLPKLMTGKLRVKSGGER
jgi:type I restriction enzyme S subunit